MISNKTMDYGSRLVQHYQAVVDLRGPLHEVLYNEALARVRGPNGALTGPQDYVYALEGSDAVIDFDHWSLTRAAEKLEQLRHRRRTVPALSVNVSGRSIGDVRFRFEVERTLASMHEPEKLCFELTETAPVGDNNQARAFLRCVQDYGCTVAIDDFGQANATWRYLDEFPRANHIKIDGAIVRGALDCPGHDSFIRDAVRAAHDRGMSVVAEHVERPEHLHYLLGFNETVDYAQGFLFGAARPDPVSIVDIRENIGTLVREVGAPSRSHRSNLDERVAAVSR